MSEVMKHSSIKLFGKTISLSKVVSGITVLEQPQSSSESSVCSQDSKDMSEVFTQKHEDNSISLRPTETLSGLSESSSPKTPTTMDEPGDDSLSPDTTLKKPDQILPCPRCNSMDTKFCYYNNYNVKQPRHFCKNCQRYWTAGGVMRNMAVGSGRRKTKNTFTPNHHPIHVSSFVQNDGFLVFVSDTFPHESITSSSNGDGLSFYNSTPHWNGTVQSRWTEPQAQPTTPSALGKHSRRGAMLMPSNHGKENLLDRPVLIPKTLRIHDPIDAAKSSIWSTLGIKNERIGSRNGTSVFKAYVAKGDRNSTLDTASMVRQANPAAFSRSLNLQESALC